MKERFLLFVGKDGLKIMDSLGYFPNETLGLQHNPQANEWGYVFSVDVDEVISITKLLKKRNIIAHSRQYTASEVHIDRPVAVAALA